MSPGWTLFLEILGAIASVVVILDYFGIKPNTHAWGSIMALNQKWKLAIMLGLVGLTLWFSGYGFYRSLRPKVIEKTVTVTVEKPVDRIVEKIVKADCPNKAAASKSQATKTNKDAPVPARQPPMTQDCGGGNCAQSSGQTGGVTAGQINVAPLARMLTPDQQRTLATLLKAGGTFTLFLRHADHNFEAQQYCDSFKAVFQEAGWNIIDEFNARMIPESRPGQGLQIIVNDVNNPPAAAVVLQQSLTKIGISAGALNGSDIAGLGKFTSTDVVFYVGVQ